jgi:hypothetical protein
MEDNSIVNIGDISNSFICKKSHLIPPNITVSILKSVINIFNKKKTPTKRIEESNR